MYIYIYIYIYICLIIAIFTWLNWFAAEYVNLPWFALRFFCFIRACLFKMFIKILKNADTPYYPNHFLISRYLIHL